MVDPQESEKKMSKWIIDIHGDIEGDYEIIEKYEEPMTDVLNKIRAEIEEYKSRQLTLAIGVEDLEKGKQIALEYVLAIIDKYRAESGDKE